MANLIEVPYDDGTTQTNIVLNVDNTMDVERAFDPVTGVKLTIVLSITQGYNTFYLRTIELTYGNATSNDDVPQIDQQSLKTAIIKSARQPGNVLFWAPANYTIDQATNSVTSYRNGAIVATTP
jgi:hypothetical protein